MSKRSLSNEVTKDTTKDGVAKSYFYTPKATLAQYSATLVISVTYLSVGMLCVINTIVVGNLLDATNDVVSLNEEEGSWFGGLPCIVQPVGAFTGILLQDFVGQRWGLMLSNVFGLASLVLLYFARTSASVLTAGGMIGLSLGFTEPSGMGYISEYSEPNLRGFLCSGTQFIASFGNLILFILSSMVNWRTAVLMCSIVPAIAILLLFWIPDSPVWLLSKGKKKKALKALIWFRGWTTEDEVREEYEDMIVFVKKSLILDNINAEEEVVLTTNDQSKAKMRQATLMDLLPSIFERRTLYPLFFITMYMLINCFSSSSGAKTYILNLCDALHTPINKDWMTINMGIATVAGNFIVLMTMKHTGKRLLAIVSIFLSSMASILLGLYVYYKDQLRMPWIFILLFFVLCIESSQTGPIPWLMMGEIFPVRTRNAGSGLGGAIFDVIIFLFLKTYFTVDRILGTELFFAVNGILGILGCVYLYFYMPETEGKTLEEIEEIFSKKSKTSDTCSSFS